MFVQKNDEATVQYTDNADIMLLQRLCYKHRSTCHVTKSPFFQREVTRRLSNFHLYVSLCSPPPFLPSFKKIFPWRFNNIVLFQAPRSKRRHDLFMSTYLPTPFEAL